MADTSEVELYYKAESTYGTVAGGNGKALRYVSSSLAQKQETVASNEITGDRQIADHIRVDVGVEGATQHEMSAGALDDLLEAGLCSAAWTGGATVTATTISCASADNSINDSGSGFGSIVAGQWIRVTGFTTNGATFFAKVVTQTTAKLVVSGITLMNESAGPSVTVKQGDYITNGSTFRSFTLETKFSDLASVFAYHTGCVINGFNIQVPTKGILTAGFNWIGKREFSSASTNMGTPTAAPTNSVKNSIDDVLMAMEGGFAAANIIQIVDGSLTIANNARKDNAVANLGPIQVGLGDFALTGAFKIYFATQTLLDKFRNRTASSFGLLVRNSSGLGYMLEVPSVIYSVGEHPVPGKNQSVIANIEFAARKDPTLGRTIRIHRWST